MGWTFPPSAVRMADLGGWHIGAEAPVPHEGAVWLDTSVTLAPVLKVWLAGSWRPLSGGEVPDVGLVAELTQQAPMPTQTLVGHVSLSAILAQQAPMPTQVLAGNVV